MKRSLPRTLLFHAVLFISSFLISEASYAQSTSWKGATSSAWATASNWTNGVPAATLDVVIGDANFTGGFQPSITATSTAKSLTIGTGAITSTLTLTARLTVSGNVTIGTSGTLAHNAVSTSYYLSLMGNFANSGTYSTVSSNALVTFNGVTQSITSTPALTFQRLTISSGTTTLNSNITVTTLLTVNGTLDPNEPTYTVTLTGASFNLGSSSFLKVKASTFSGNYTLEPTTVNARATIDYGATTTNQTISNTITYGILKTSGAMAKTLAGNLPNLQSSSSTGGYITVSAGTLDLQGYTASRNAAGGTVTVSNGATLKIGGTNSFPGNFTTKTFGASSTVEYDGANQTVIAATYGNLTLSGSTGSGAVMKTLPATAFTIAGNLITNVGGATSLTFTAANILTVTGNVIIGASTTFNASTFSHSLSGSFTNNGIFNGSTGTISLKGVSKAISGIGATMFYNLTITGAGVTADATTSFTVGGAFATSGSGTFTHSSGNLGTITLSGTTKTITGAGISFNNLTVSGVITATVGFAIKGDLTVTNSFTSTAGIITLSGTSNAITGSATTFKLFSLTVSGTYSCSTSFIITSAFSVTGSFTASMGTITFAGTAQPITGSPNFYALVINSGSTVTLNGNITVTNALILNGTLDPNEPTYIVTLTGASSFSLSSTAVLKVKAGTFSGNYTINPTSVNLASTIDYAASTINQTISNAITYGVLKISGTMTKILAGNLPALTGSVNVTGGTLDLLNYTANRASLGGTFTVVNGATLNIGGTNSFPSNYNSITLGASSTVQYNGTNQTVIAATYGNLTLSSGNGASVKTMPASTFTVAGNLISTIGSGTAVTFTAGNNIVINGNVTIGASTTFNAGIFLHTLAGNFTNNGTLTSGGTFVFSGAAKTIDGIGTTTFYSLTITGAGITTPSSISFTLNGNFTTSGAGTFTHTPGGAGIITLSGSSKTITGTGATFNNLTISGTISTSVPTFITGDLTVTNSFITIAVVTLSGTANVINGAGAIMTLTSLTVSGTYTCSRSFTLSSDLTVTGSLTASTGTVTFNGTSTLNGIANLYNAILNGTSLTMGGNANLGIAATFTKTSGTFDVTTNIPNTVTFNGNSAQTINALTYYHLVLSTGGIKTAAGNMTVHGNFTINPNTTFNAGSYSHTYNEDFINNGSFTAGTSTVQMTESIDATIKGQTTFNVLTVNKTSMDNLVALGNNITAATLNMTSGILDGESYTITITSVRTGPGNIIKGTITHTHSFTTGVGYEFSNPYNTVTFTAVSGVTSVSETITSTSVDDFPSGAAVHCEYVFSVPAGTYTANIRLNYQDADLNGNTEANMSLWQNTGSGWVIQGKSGNSTINNYVELDAITNIVGEWTMSDNTTSVSWTGFVSTAWEEPGNWSGSLVPSATDVVNLGNNVFTNQPTISSAISVRSISFSSTTPVTLTIGTGGSLTTNTALGGGIAGIWTGNATHTINVGSQSLVAGGDFTLSDGTAGHVINLNIGTGSATLKGQLFQTGGANVTFTGNGTLNLSESYEYTSGTLTPGTGTIAFNGSASQEIAKLTYYNLTIDKTTGITTSPWPVHVTNNLTLNTSAIYDVDDSLVVNGNISINTGTVMKGNGANILLAGNWVNNGTFTIGSSTVAIKGSGAQNISASGFNNLTINKASGTATLAGNIIISNNLTLASGILDLSSYSADRNIPGGIFTVGAGTTLKIGGTTNFPNNYTVNSLAPTSIVEYNGTGIQTVKSVSYGNVIFTNGVSNAKTLGGTTTITGDLLINSGATFAGNAYTLTLLGNWTNNGTFTPSTGTVILSGLSKTLAGATTFNALNVSGTYAGSSSITISGAANISGTYSAGATTDIFSGDFINTGTFSSSGTITFSGTSAQALQINSELSTSGIVNFNGTVAPTITSNSFPIFNTLNINNTGGINAGNDWTVNGTCTIASGATFTGGAYTHTFYGAFTNNGTVTSSDTLNFFPSTSSTVALTGTTFTSTGTVVFGGSSALTISGTPGTITNIIVSNISGITLPSSWTISGDIIINNGCTLNAGTALNHTITGTLDAIGTFNGGTSTVTMNGNSKNIIGTGSISFYNLTIGTGGSITALTNFGVMQDFTNNATFSATGYEVAFIGSGASVISGTTSPTSIDILTVNKTSATTTVSVNLNKLLQMNVVSGTLDLSNKTITQIAGGGTLTVDSSAVLKIGGNNNIPTFNTYNLAEGGTEEFNGAIQTISSTPVYGNLTISAGGNKTAGGALTVAGDFSLSAGTFIGGNYIHSMQGNWIMSGGTFTNTNTTIAFNGVSDQVVNSTGSFNNLTINNSGGTINLASNITINGTLTFTNGNISTGSYIVIIPSAGTVSQTSGYVIGNLQRAFSSVNLSRKFDVGDGNGYSPATVTFANISAPGNLIVAVTAGEDPDIVNSSIDPGKNVNKYWTLTNSGISFSNYGITFGFASSDMDPSSNPANFIVAHRTAGIWIFPTVGIKTSTSAQCTGNTAFGDFLVGEYGQKIWDGGAGTNNWGDANNWNPDGVPVSTDNIVLTGANTINVNVAAVCKDLTLNNVSLTLSILTSQSITASGNFTLTSGTLNTANSFPVVAGTTTITGGTVTYNGSGAQTVAANNYHNLSLTNTGIKTFASGISGVSGVFTISGAASADAITNATQIDYNSAGNQNVLAINYYDLSVDSSGTKTFNSGTVGIAGSLSISGSASINATTNSPTVSYNGNGNQDIGAVNYYNLILNNAGTKTFSPGITEVSGALTITGAAIPDANSNLPTIQFNGSGAQTIPAINYYNLIVSNGGTKSLGSAITVNGDLTISGPSNLNATTNNYGITLVGNWVNNGSAGTTFNAQNGTVTFNGTTIVSGSAATPFKNITINSGKSLTFNLTNTIISGAIQNNGTLTDNTGTITLNGNTTFGASGSTNLLNLINNGPFNLSSGILNVAGNLTNSSTINTGTGVIVFNGLANQNITSGGTTFYNATINNTSGVTLLDNFTISNTLTLTSGKINTGSFRVIISIPASEAIQGFTSASYINGNLRRYILNNTLTYSFPVGTASKYTLAEITNHNLSGVSYIDASFAVKPGNDNGLSCMEQHTFYSSINNAGVWFLTPDATPSSGTYDLKCYLNAFTGLLDNSFAILSRPDASTNAADWNKGGGTLNQGGGLGRKVSDGYALRLNLTSFSQKGIGQAGTVLPITLLYFNAKIAGANALLNWSTATERNSDYFDIEVATNTVSGNELIFKKIGEVKAEGNSVIDIDYQFIDSNIVESGIRYYRLKEVDLDNSYTYSDIRVLEFDDNPYTLSEIFPNPSSDNISFNLTSQKAINFSFLLINSMGQTVKKENRSLQPGIVLTTINITDIPSGIYFLDIEDLGNGSHKIQKLVKHNK